MLYSRDANLYCEDPEHQIIPKDPRLLYTSALRQQPAFLPLAAYTMADPSKAETEKIFKVLRAQKGNRVSHIVYHRYNHLTTGRCALTARLGILLGQA